MVLTETVDRAHASLLPLDRLAGAPRLHPCSLRDMQTTTDREDGPSRLRSWAATTPSTGHPIQMTFSAIRIERQPLTTLHLDLPSMPA